MSRAQIVEAVFRSIKNAEDLPFNEKVQAAKEGLKGTPGNKHLSGNLSKRITKALINKDES